MTAGPLHIYFFKHFTKPSIDEEMNDYKLFMHDTQTDNIKTGKSEAGIQGGSDLTKIRMLMSIKNQIIRKKE